jgi:hypothetical protein
VSTFRWRRADDGEPALFGMDELLLPDLGTGRMSDLEFLHVNAKRILNHVPGNSRAPANWTINVYRGCSHACNYCLSGDTPVLMADGRSKPIADVRRGDKVYGTVRRGSYRRYVPTDVLAQWSTVKPAWRIALEDGTEILASGDHRFLTDRGWKYVSPAVRPGQRPHLTPNNHLLGVGRLATSPRHCGEYRRGYLTGMIRGDANLATYHYARAGRSDATVHRFRLALADLEPLHRSQQWLAQLGVPTTMFAFTPRSETRRAMTAIRTSKKAAVDQIRQMIEWPETLNEQWMRGFLAGIFDAEGGHSHGVLRISNTDPAILDHNAKCDCSGLSRDSRTAEAERSAYSSNRWRAPRPFALLPGDRSGDDPKADS